MAFRMQPRSKLLDLLGLAVAVFCIAAGLYRFAVRRTLPLPTLLAVLALFTSGLIASTLSLRSGNAVARGGALAPTRKQALAVIVGGLLFAFPGLYFCIWAKGLAFGLRVFLLFGFLFFAWGTVRYTVRVRRQLREAAQQDPEPGEQVGPETGNG